MTKRIFAVEIQTEADLFGLVEQLSAADWVQAVHSVTLMDEQDTELAPETKARVKEALEEQVAKAEEQEPVKETDVFAEETPAETVPGSEAEDPEEPEQSEEVDINGDPWDPEKHSTTKAKNADGSWRAKRKVKKGAAKEEPEEKPDPAAPQGSDDFTKEDVREALKDLNKKQGMQACMKALERFNASSVSELDPKEYEPATRYINHLANGAES